tara:strand:- start:1673 stop:1858 length:186 start_codon:yes stop_codon:yes gene_type:complete
MRMLNVGVQLGLKMDPRSMIDAPVARILRRLVATLVAVAAVHAGDARTIEPALAIENPVNS